MTNIIETKIVSTLINKLVTNGYTLRGVRDLEAFTRTPTVKDAMEEIFAVEHCALILHKDERREWIYLIPGNDEHIICDHTDSSELEQIINAALAEARLFA